MKRDDLLEKKMIVGDLDGDAVVRFLKKHGIEYYNIQECKTNWISINKNGEVAYYLRENGFNQCAYPEINLGDIIYQDLISSFVMPINLLPPGKEHLVCIAGVHKLAKEDFLTEWDRLIAECEKDVRDSINETYKKAENEGRLIDGELYIDGKKYASIALHKIEDIARWIESKKSLKDLNETMKRVEEEVKNNSDILDCVSGAHEMFSRQLEKQQEDLIKAATGKFARYEKVLVRAGTKLPWQGHIFVGKNGPYYECANGAKFLYCIPFDPEKLGRVTE